MLGYSVVAFNRSSKTCSLNNNLNLRLLPTNYRPNKLLPLGIVNDKSVPLICNSVYVIFVYALAFAVMMLF